MDAVLVKKGGIYFLEKVGFNGLEVIGNSIEKPKGDLYDLSISNCKEIELDIDLNKIKEDYIKKRTSNYDADTLDKYLSFVEEDANEFINGFLLGIEMFGDRRFTLSDIKKAYNRGSYDDRLNNKKLLDDEKYAQSVQEKQWNVVIEMEEYARKLTGRGVEVMKIKLDKPIPKLDTKGCVILKRK